MEIIEPIMVRSLVRDEAATYLAPFLHEDHSVGEAAAPEWVIAGDFRISAASPLRGSRARVLRDGRGGPPTSHQSSQGLRITAEQAGQLVQEITALLDRWTQRGDDSSDLTSFRVDIALAPMPD